MKKVFFAAIAQNNAVSLRFFDTQKTVEEVAKVHPQLITENNSGWLETDAPNLNIISSVDQFDLAPQQQGQQNMTTEQSTQNKAVTA